MKQLKRLLLFISCIFFLPVVQDESPFYTSSSQAILKAHIQADRALVEDHAGEMLSVTEGLHKYNHRTRALNDYHELCLFVASIRIKSLFVYIPKVYRGYKVSYISVAVTLSDWRGPPVA